MEITPKLIFEFNKNKNKDFYRKIFLQNFKNKARCRICDDVIYYYNSAFVISKTGELKLLNKSCESNKIVDKKYFLSVCEDCLAFKFPEYKTKNKSRIFNHMNYITAYAFDIPDNIAREWAHEKYAMTKDNMIKKYGTELGLKKWETYCQRQSFTNTLEYKQSRFGWTEEEFKEYNKSRSVTLENLIDRHGLEKGIEVWDKYVERQRHTTTLKYFIEKHGVEKGTSIYENFCKKRIVNAGYSEVSKKLFDDLVSKINEKQVYYGENEWYQYDKMNRKYYLLDFYIRDLNIAIEFNGDLWHANPSKYKAEDIPPCQGNLTASQIWKRDEAKQTFLKTKLKKLIIIWESDLYRDGTKLTIDKILKEIYE